MKTGCRRLSLLLATLTLVLISGTAAEAACSSAVTFNTGIYPNQNYVYAPAGASSDGVGSLHLGYFWEPGKRTTQGSGTYDVAQWWKRFGNYPFYLDGNLTVPEVVGCPGGPVEFGGDPGPEEMIILLLDRQVDGSEAYYAVLRPDFCLSCGTQYDMGTTSTSGIWGDIDLQPMPMVNVQATSRVGNTLSIAVSFDDVKSGFHDGIPDVGNTVVGKSPYDAITAHEICTLLLPNSTVPTTGFPGRSVSADGWQCGPDSAATPHQVPTAEGGASANIDLVVSDPSSFVYVASRLIIDDGQEAGDAVSAHTILEGDPNLAQPEPIKQPVRRPVDQRPSSPRSGAKPKRR